MCLPDLRLSGVVWSVILLPEHQSAGDPMRLSLAQWLLRKVRASNGPARGRRCRPSVQALEDRCVPSNMVLSVNSAGDDPSGPTAGVVTLRDAITAVNNDAADNAASPDVIQFAINGKPTVSLAANLPAITRPVFIDGSTQ